MQEINDNGLQLEQRVLSPVFSNQVDGALAGVILKTMDRKKKDLNGEQNAYRAKV